MAAVGQKGKQRLLRFSAPIRSADNRCDELRRGIQALQFRPLIEFVSGSGKIAEDTYDQVLSAKSLGDLSKGCPLHVERQSAMGLEQSLSGRCTKDEDVAADNPSKMDFD
jgi:hypothetical protein